MKIELKEKLLKSYPELFSNDPEISCGDGWYNLIDTLCLELYSSFNSAKSIYENCLDNHGEKMYSWIDSSPTVDASMLSKLYSEMYERSLKLPKITQIKEKFGTLRFYADGITEDQSHMIYFAELASSKICEVCGSSAPDSVHCYAGVYKTRCNSCKN